MSELTCEQVLWVSCTNGGAEKASQGLGSATRARDPEREPTRGLRVSLMYDCNLFIAFDSLTILLSRETVANACKEPGYRKRPKRCFVSTHPVSKYSFTCQLQCSFNHLFNHTPCSLQTRIKLAVGRMFVT